MEIAHRPTTACLGTKASYSGRDSPATKARLVD
jgi:integrase